VLRPELDASPPAGDESGATRSAEKEVLGGEVEIRIVLDIVEPPAGRLGVVGDPGQTHHPGSQQEISFSGWLGLLRALYELTAEPGEPWQAGTPLSAARLPGTHPHSARPLR
jgi:hypothetical protein